MLLLTRSLVLGTKGAVSRASGSHGCLTDTHSSAFPGAWGEERGGQAGGRGQGGCTVARVDEGRQAREGRGVHGDKESARRPCRSGQGRGPGGRGQREGATVSIMAVTFKGGKQS
jgi:hypothetical protein